MQHFKIKRKYTYIFVHPFSSDANKMGKNIDTKTPHTKYLHSVSRKKDEPEPLVNYHFFFFVQIHDSKHETPIFSILFLSLFVIFLARL